jgi:hypothetical protein
MFPGRMLERYSHIRMEAKRNALEAISQSGIGNGTVNGTKNGAKAPDAPILGIKMVGAWGFEPQTPTVSR